MPSKLIRALREAWELLLEVPLPFSALAPQDELDEDDEHLVLAAFPAVGFLLGIFAYAIIWIMACFMSQTAVAIIAAPCLVIGYEMLSFGRNFDALTGLLEGRLQRLPANQTLALVENERSGRGTMGMMFFVGLFVIRLFAVAVLIHRGLESWLIVTLVMSGLVQARLAMARDLRTSQPLLKSEEDRAIPAIWAVACTASLLAGIWYFPAVLLLWLLAWVIVGQFRIYCERNFGGISANLVGAGASFSELIFLLAGLLMLVRG